MDLLTGLNAAVEYIEAHLQGEIDIGRAARRAAHSADGFSRLFSYLSGMTLNEYIRRRRLTKAAYELRDGGAKVIDIAVKYVYNSADAFSRAFSRQHGVTPTEARDLAVPLRVFPPISFHINFTGAQEMDFRITETGPIELRGLSKPFTGGAADRFEQEHIMWADHHDNAVAAISGGNIPGTWYAVWDGGTYSIGRAAADATGADLQDVRIEGGAYAVFVTGPGGFAGDELPKLRELIFGAWLADSGYRQTRDYEVEVYYLYPRDERHLRRYELWVPVERA